MKTGIAKFSVVDVAVAKQTKALFCCPALALQKSFELLTLPSLVTLFPVTGNRAKRIVYLLQWWYYIKRTFC